MAVEKPYHHGNLKEALLDASIALIREKGLDGLTLRQVASRAGVSHTAPYRHFRDKNHLLVTLSEASLVRIGSRITYHSLKGYSPKECLMLGVVAFLRYALERPDEFRLLLESPASPEIPCQAIEALVVPCAFSRVNPAAAARILWVHIHGIAELATRKQHGSMSRKKSLDFAAESIQFLLIGFQ